MLCGEVKKYIETSPLLTKTKTMFKYQITFCWYNRFNRRKRLFISNLDLPCYLTNHVLDLFLIYCPFKNISNTSHWNINDNNQPFRIIRENIMFHILPFHLKHGLFSASSTKSVINVFRFSTFSGGHFNPAVTLGVALNGGISISLSVLYFFAQMIGGALGAAFTRVSSINVIKNSINNALYFKITNPFSVESRLINFWISSW